MDLLDHIIRSRRTIRKFTAKKVNHKEIKKLLVSGCWAPSAHHSQPWRFVILDQGETKVRLAKEMSRYFRKDLMKDKTSSKIIDLKVGRSLNRISKAPVVVLVCLSKEKLRVYSDFRRNRIEEDLALQSIGASIQNILLSGYEMGLGICWMSAPIFCPKIVSKILRIPKGWNPSALLLVGYPDEKPKPPRRFGVARVSMWLQHKI